CGSARWRKAVSPCIVSRSAAGDGGRRVRSHGTSIGNYLPQQAIINAHLSQMFGDHSPGAALTVDIATPPTDRLAVAPHRPDSLFNGPGIMLHMLDIAASLATELTWADVDHRSAKAGSFDDPAGTVAHHDGGLAHQPQEQRPLHILVNNDPLITH